MKRNNYKHTESGKCKISKNLIMIMTHMPNPQFLHLFNLRFPHLCCFHSLKFQQPASFFLFDCTLRSSKLSFVNAPRTFSSSCLISDQEWTADFFPLHRGRGGWGPSPPPRKKKKREKTSKKKNYKVILMRRFFPVSANFRGENKLNAISVVFIMPGSSRAARFHQPLYID